MSEELSLREIRLQKLARMRELGHDPFAVEEFKRDGSAEQILAMFEGKDEEALKATSISFAGRIVSYRDMGKAGFAHLSDGDSKIQIYCRKDDLEGIGWDLYQLLDIGDHVGVEGYLFHTRTGERSIHVSRLVPLSKCLETLPIGKEKDGEQWYGLTDVEQRYRHRHLDLIANPEARKALIDRSKIVSAVRRYFDGAGYLEVETPLLQVIAGGAAARPFSTHYNAYDMDVKLRISLELYLKRLICGDIPAVYEIGRVFRNEGVSNRHNPEFTLLEFYESYTNLEGMMRRVEECFKHIVDTVYGGPVQYLNLQLARILGFADLKSLETGILVFPFLLAKLKEEVALELFSTAEALSVNLSGRKWKFIFEGETESSDKPPYECEIHLTDGIVTTMETAKFYGFRVESDSAELVVSKVGEQSSRTLRQGHYVMPKQFVNACILDFHKPWRRVNLIDEIAIQTGLEKADLRDLTIAKSAIIANGVLDKAHQLGGHIDLKKEDNLGGLIEKLLEIFVEPTFQAPTFVVGYPIETSPLAKKDPRNPRMTRRFEGYINGREICNAFSEINDPIDQRERFEQQAEQITKGDEEAHPYDEEFIHALECGMPPTGGCGIGMERLAMVFTGSEHIREIMFFPMMKPVSIIPSPVSEATGEG